MKRMLLVVGLLVVALGSGVLALTLHAGDVVQAQTPVSGILPLGKACEISGSNSIEVGPPGSGKPQRVRERWHINEDCSVTRTERVEERVQKPKDNSADGQSALLACASVQNEFVMDDVIGIDLTRSDVAANWCYDGSQVTWWASPPAHNAWASPTGWQVDAEYPGDTWVTTPWVARAYNDAYFHYGPCNCYYHQLFPKVDFYGDGSAICRYSQSGSFPLGADLDQECYYF